MSVLIPITDDNRDRVAVSDASTALTWGELDERANQTACALTALDLGHGSRLAVLMRNRVAWVEIIVGTLLAGLEYLPINWHLTPSEVAYLLEDSSARVILYDEENRDLALAAAALAPDVVAINVDSEWPARLATQPVTFEPPGPTGGVLLYTGGSTGRPKAVIRSEVRSVPLADFPDFNRRNALQLWHFPSAPGVFLSVCPLYHSAPPGLLTYALFLGSRVHILDRFDAESTLAAIAALDVTCMAVVPTQMIRMLRLPPATRERYDVSSLEYVLHGAAPCPRWAKEELISWFGPVVWEYYGAVEGTGPILCDSTTFLDRPGTVGKPPPNIDVWVEDDEGRPLPAGEVGTLWFRRGGSHPIYHNDAAKTSAAVRPDGSYTIGDFGRFDSDGYLYIADRRADMILSGGVNIYPAEIEAALSEHPAIRDVAVIGLDDDEWGKRVHAIVSLEDGSTASEQELDRHCRQRLAGFKCPRSYEVVARVARDESGKLRRHQIRSGLAASGRHEQGGT
jgi:long-chain acyl-CoA synthetase